MTGLDDPIGSNPATANRLARWSARSCALATLPPVVAFVFAVLNRGDHESPYAATALASSFLGVFFGLIGLFGFTIAIDMSPAIRRPRWCVVCGLIGILGGFSMGLFGIILGRRG